jgi:hypothetical protein
MNLTTQDILLGNADDRDGVLVLDGDVLVAVLCRLSAEHGEGAGRWFLECSFGLTPLGRDVFDTIEDACNGIAQSIDKRESEMAAATARKPKGTA